MLISRIMGIWGYMATCGKKIFMLKRNYKKNQAILDHMNSEELAANLFRATQAEAKLKRENILGQHKANQAHYDVGKKFVRPLKNWAALCQKIYQTPG